MRVLVFTLVCLSFACGVTQAQAQVRSVATSEPRDVGYLVGDVIERTIEIKVDEAFKLVRGSLPQPGKLAYWLNLLSVEAQERGSGGLNTARVKLRYQTFYAALDTRKQTIPGMALRFTDGEKVAVAEVPPWKFTTSPLREISPGGEGQTLADQLRPDIRPRLSNTRPTERTLIVMAVLAALAALALARHYAVWPFRRRPGRPFTRAAAQIGRLRPGENGENYETAVLTLHRAFDSAAGKRLLGEDIEAFLDKHPNLASARDRVVRFFDVSSRLFYRGDRAGAIAELPGKDLVAIARELGEAERRAA